MSKYFRNFIDVQSTMPEEEQTATTQQKTNRKNTEWMVTSHQPSSLAILVEWLHNLICVPGLSGVMSTKLENKIKHVYVKSKYDGIFIEVRGVNL